MRWAGKLWLITYPPHDTRGGRDKLWTIDENLRLEMRPESIGGTHAARFIHRDSNQLIIGPYFVDSAGNVRALNVKKDLIGRMTAVVRHLTDPARLVYFYDMEGSIYEVDVQTLAVKMLFEKPVPGYHGKGAYTGQGRLIVANNGETASGRYRYTKLLAGGEPENEEDAGALAEWDGQQWRIVARRQFTDVMGPGGISGATSDSDPVWAIGWDKRSVLLMVLDGGRWHRYRLPKATHTYDPKHGWYTEWPRIREAAPGRWLLDMHGMFYEFPQAFSASQSGGIRPVGSHLRYVPDFCHWNGRLVLATDETSLMRNPMAGRAQSNLWFGTWEDLQQWGPRSGWGGVWRDDRIRAGEKSDPLLVAGFEHCVLHLAHDAGQELAFGLEAKSGDGEWTAVEPMIVPTHGYAFQLLPSGLNADWIRLVAPADCTATAYFHFSSQRQKSHDEAGMFAALADVEDDTVNAGLIRPAAHNTNLQFVARSTVECIGGTGPLYCEVNERIEFVSPKDEAGALRAELEKIAEIRRDFEVDQASVIMVHKGQRYRLPKGDPAFDKPFALGWTRGIRECESERFLVNVHGTFYEMPHDDGLPLIKPVCSHRKQILDFCTWRGLLVMSGTSVQARPDGHYFAADKSATGLWFGAIDDLWKLGKPVGRGGPWLMTAVEPDVPSDPYLMTNYDRKTMELSHDAEGDVTFQVEIDFDHGGWHPYAAFTVSAGDTLTHEFPAGFAAHWLRVRSDRPCRATAQLEYR
ncbi:MAG: hypothetical protein ACOY3P_10390 [Planctomycetota bacterium]